MVKIECRSPLIDKERKVNFEHFELNTDECLRFMYSTFHPYAIMGPIKVDATVARSTNDIFKMLKHPQPSHVFEMSS